MNLNWEDMPDALYVRGHMSPEDASRALRDYYGHEFIYETPAPCFGRWSTEAGLDGCGHVLRTYREAGRGRFAIMEARVVKSRVGSWNWQRRRTQMRWDAKLGERVSAIPQERRCDCDTHDDEICACGGSCACHWRPQEGIWWKRQAREVQP